MQRLFVCGEGHGWSCGSEGWACAVKLHVKEALSQLRNLYICWAATSYVNLKNRLKASESYAVWLHTTHAYHLKYHISLHLQRHMLLH